MAKIISYKGEDFFIVARVNCDGSIYSSHGKYTTRAEAETRRGQVVPLEGQTVCVLTRAEYQAR